MKAGRISIVETFLSEYDFFHCSMISGSEVVCRKSRYLSRFYVIHFKSQFILWSPIQRKCYLFYLCLHFLLKLDLFNFTDYNQLKTYLLDKYNIPVFQYHTQGSRSCQIFGGAKKNRWEGVYIFSIWAPIVLSWAKKKYLVGQTPKLWHSRYAPESYCLALIFF